jgi:hypothetical protein
LALATLSIDLVAKLANLQSGMDKAVRIAEKDAARMERAFLAVRNVAAGIGGAIGLGLSGAGFTQLITQSNAALLAIKDLAEGTGSTIENVSGLENALRNVGRQLSEAQPVLVKFNGALKEADGKNGISLALRAIGLEASELRKLDPVQALQEVARALQGFADDGDKARLVQELFGKSVAEVIPLLNDLAESQLKATDGIREAAEEADKFEKNVARLQTRLGDLGRTLAGPVVAGLNRFFDSIEKGQKSGGGFLGGFTEQYREDFLRARLKELDRQIGKGIPGLQGTRDSLAGELDSLLYAGGSRRPANEGGGGLATTRRIGDITALLGGGGASSSGGRRSSGSSAAAEIGPFVGPLIPESLTAALRAIEQTDTAKLAELRKQLQELLSLQAAGQGGSGVAEAIASTQKAIDDLDPALAAAAERSERLNALLAATPSAQIAEASKEVELLREELLKATDPAIIQRLNEALTAALERTGAYGNTVDEVNEKLKDSADVAADLGLTFTSAFEDAIVGGKGLRELLSGLEQDILRIVTRNLVTQPLGNALTGLLSNGLGGIFGGLFGGLFGESPGFASVAGISGGRASGGDVFGNGIYRINERGKEWLYMGANTRGTVVPSGSGPGAMTVMQNFTVSGATDRRTQQQIAAAAARGLAMAQRSN